jgi:hypothetical protein
MGSSAGFLLSGILLLTALFFAGRYLFGLCVRHSGKKYFVPLVALSILAFGAMLWAAPYTWLLLGILLSGENFSR